VKQQLAQDLIASKVRTAGMSTFRAHTFNLSTQFPNAVLGLELRIISHCVGWPQECLFLPF
jgi:hypothetical protein